MRSNQTGSVLYRLYFATLDMSQRMFLTTVKVLFIKVPKFQTLLIIFESKSFTCSNNFVAPYPIIVEVYVLSHPPKQEPPTPKTQERKISLP